MDPHKRSATIEVIDHREKVLLTGRFGTDRDGYQRMLAAGRRYSGRTWAIEGCNGIGRHIAQRLVADGERVVDVPAKLSARARVFSPGRAARPTRWTRTRSRSSGCARIGCDASRSTTRTVALRLLADRRDELGLARSQTVNRLHRLLLELLPGGAKKFLSARSRRGRSRNGASL
jgi:hypothetical protein